VRKTTACAAVSNYKVHGEDFRMSVDDYSQPADDGGAE